MKRRKDENVFSFITCGGVTAEFPFRLCKDWQRQEFQWDLLEIETCSKKKVQAFAYKMRPISLEQEKAYLCSINKYHMKSEKYPRNPLITGSSVWQ